MVEHEQKKLGANDALKHKDSYKTCKSCRAAGLAWCMDTKKCTEDRRGACHTRETHVGIASDLPDCNNRPLVLAQNGTKKLDATK